MKFTDKNTILVKEFDRYILEYPELRIKYRRMALL